MKRIISLALCMALLAAAFSAAAQSGSGQRNEALDAAFEAGNLMLTETHIVPERLTPEDLELTEGWKESIIQAGIAQDPEAEVREGLQDAEVTLLSLSPAGNSGIVAVNHTGVAYYGGKYRLLYPSAERSVEDSYGNLLKYYTKYVSGNVEKLIGEEGVEYSPDGRYAAMYNIQIPLIRMDFFLDPIIIDLATGELILTATSPAKFMEADAEAVTAATFSADGRSLYYVTYGMHEEGATRLYRYDLKDGTTELCVKNAEWVTYPHLEELRDGSLIMLNTPTRLSEKRSVMHFRRTGGSWTAEKILEKEAGDVFIGNMLEYNAKSGWAVVNGQSFAGWSLTFRLFRPNEDYEGYDRFICIAKGSDQAAVLDEAAFRAACEQGGNGAAGISQNSFPYQYILYTVLSPDGNYLLLYTSEPTAEGNAFHLLLMRLEDLAVREVGGVETLIHSSRLGLRHGAYIEWNTDNLILGTAEGIRTYRFGS